MPAKDGLNEERFIRNVRRSLGFSPDKRRSPQGLFPAEGSCESAEIVKRVEARTLESRMELLGLLMESAKSIQLQVIPVEDIVSASAAIAQLVEEKQPEWGTQKSITAWRHPLIDGLHLPDLLVEQNVPVYIPDLAGRADVDEANEDRRKEIRSQVIDSYIGVTSADFCIAETATLVMKTRPGQARSVSLVPSIHVAVIELEQILMNLKELYAVLQCDPKQREEGLTNCMTFISGPSKTADIELVMVHGAHGPRELYLYVITGVT